MEVILMILLSTILDVVHLYIPLMILDEELNAYIYETDSYDGKNDFPDYSVQGIRVHKGKLLISVKPY